MAFSSPSSSVAATANVTPLIDVLLVLLIIFMVISPVSSRGIESLVPQPSTRAEHVAEDAPMLLEVGASKTGAEPVSYHLDGANISVQTLQATLRSRLARSRQPALLIRGDAHLDYSRVAVVVSLAWQAGFRSIGLLIPGTAAGQRS